jgi:hypothetical protein
MHNKQSLGEVEMNSLELEQETWERRIPYEPKRRRVMATRSTIRSTHSRRNSWMMEA